MKTEIKIQELSDGRFRNAVTGRIGDSIDAVVRDDGTDNAKKKIPLLKNLYSIIGKDIKSFEKAAIDGNIVEVNKLVFRLKRDYVFLKDLVEDLTRYR